MLNILIETSTPATLLRYVNENNIAKKQVLFTFTPDKSQQRENIEIKLNGYQWAKLAIEPAYINFFKGFGDKGIVALTAKNRIHNKSSATINVNSLDVTLTLPSSKASAKASADLGPK